MPPLVRMFQAIAISTVGTTGWAVFVLAQETDMGRLRQVGLSWFLRKLGLAFDVDLARLWPSVFGQQYPLTSWSEASVLLASALLVNLAIAFAIGALLLPVVWLAYRALPPTGRAAERLWGVAFPVAMGLLFAIPAAARLWGYDPARLVAPGGGGLLGPLAAVAMTGLLLLVLSRFVPTRWIDSLLMLGSVASVAVVVAFLALAAFVDDANAPAATRAASPGAPNVLLVSIDSLRADHVHAYGYQRETTPRIDALGDEGVRFETVVSPSSWTLPSHMTLLSALDPRDHGVMGEEDKLGPEAVMLAEVFRDAGYTTSGFVSGPFLDAEFGYLQGFDLYDDYSALPANWRRALTDETSTGLHRAIRAWLLDWDDAGREKPFFAFLHMWDVHFEYSPPGPADAFETDYVGSIASLPFDSEEINPSMDPADLSRFVALYDGEILHTDAYLGKVVDVLAELGVLDDTIVVVTADHGEEFFEHGHKGHDRTLYEESVRVPLLIRYPPAVPARTVVPDLVRLQDVAPTILALAGVEQPADFGLTERASPRADRDLSPLIRVGATHELAPLAALGDHRAGEIGSIRTDEYKLIIREDGSTELYDVVRDPGELEDLSEAHPEHVRELIERYEAHTSRGGPPLSKPKELTAEQIEGLRSLGYVE